MVEIKRSRSLAWRCFTKYVTAKSHMTVGVRHSICSKRPDDQGRSTRYTAAWMHEVIIQRQI